MELSKCVFDCLNIDGTCSTLLSLGKFSHLPTLVRSKHIVLSCCNIKYNSCTKGSPSFKIPERSYFIVLSLKLIMDLLGISAGVAELADALGLGPSGRKAVGVQVPSPAPFSRNLMFLMTLSSL